MLIANLKVGSRHIALACGQKESLCPDGLTKLGKNEEYKALMNGLKDLMAILDERKN